MDEIKEVFDVSQYPQKYGGLTDLEKRVAAIEKRFAEIYDKDFIAEYGINAWGFKTPQGTRFTVNAIYEWQTVFLEYDDGEDGDMIPLKDYDEDQMFQVLCEEILISEKDQLQAKENAYRIYKVEQGDDGLIIHFRFWGDKEKVEALYSHKRVFIDGVKYRYKRYGESIQTVIVYELPVVDLYDHWIKFI